MNVQESLTQADFPGCVYYEAQISDVQRLQWSGQNCTVQWHEATYSKVYTEVYGFNFEAIAKAGKEVKAFFFVF